VCSLITLDRRVITFLRDVKGVFKIKLRIYKSDFKLYSHNCLFFLFWSKKTYNFQKRIIFFNYFYQLKDRGLVARLFERVPLHADFFMLTSTRLDEFFEMLKSHE
jgi:hypothetical protein